MNQLWNLFNFLSLFIYSSMAFNVLRINKRTCEIDNNNKSITIHNLRYNCNNNQLHNIFGKLKAGTFPPNGRLKGHALHKLAIENIWNGKNINYLSGTQPNDHGIVTNSILEAFNLFKATIYRSKYPIDGKEAFIIDYKDDLSMFLIVDYVRKVQTDLYMGLATFRSFEKYPISFFLLEKV